MPHQVSVNNMKKIFPVIVGVLVGIVVSAAMITYGQENVAYGELGLWDDVVASGQSFNWNNVFSPSSNGQDLYVLVHEKLLVYPEENALREISKNYGLTTTETELIISGSITPIFNNPDKFNVSQEDALLQMEAIQDDFEVLHEVFALEQEIEVAITPSEIFANNNLSDSGFDLISDLSRIEEILFVEIIPNTLGFPYENQLDSPYVPSQTNVSTVDLVQPAADSAILELEFLSSNDGGSDSETVSLGLTETGEAVFTIGDSEVPVEVLEADICIEGSVYSDALADLEEDLKATGDGVAGGSGGVAEADGGADAELGDLIAGVDAELFAAGVLDEDGDLIPAPQDNWLTDWCPSISSDGGNTASGSSFGQTGFSSLGNVTSSILNQSAGAAAAAGNEGLAAHIAVCVETSVVMETVASYNPGDSCVACEIEKINIKLDETLSHSLIPNKATGNQLEAAKCKDSYEVSGVDMKFITIAVPVPTPSNDDVIFGKNVFEEWKKFVDRYQPLIFSQVTADKLIERQTQNLPEGATQQEVINSVEADIAKLEAEALVKILNAEVANDGTNTVLYAQTVSGELKMMAEFFKNYKIQYDDIAATCKKITEKSNIE